MQPVAARSLLLYVLFWLNLTLVRLCCVSRFAVSLSFCCDYCCVQAKSKEPELALEVLRSIIRALLVFNQIPGVELCTQYTHFYKQVCATSLMQKLIQEEYQTGK